MLKEFKKFAMRGNVVDMAIGVIIGGAFGKIVTAVVNDLLMPPLSLLTGSVDFSNQFIALNGVHYETLMQARAAGAPILAFGSFLNTVIDFLIVAFVIFWLVKLINKVNPPPAPGPAPRKCPYCREVIADDAVRCPHCASDLKKEED